MMLGYTRIDDNEVEKTGWNPTVADGANRSE